MPRHFKVKCHSCRRPFPEGDMNTAEIQTARQTHWEPAEYDEVLVCDDCFNGDGPDEEYERANLKFKEETGSEL